MAAVQPVLDMQIALEIQEKVVEQPIFALCPWTLPLGLLLLEVGAAEMAELQMEGLGVVSLEVQEQVRVLPVAQLEETRQQVDCRQQVVYGHVMVIFSMEGV